ncbi:MAG: hypothetical protein WBX15_01995 [Thermoanaerobaculia bacterium]
MITGFNTDIRHNDRIFHIQTEDKGLNNPYIESLVYVGGEILASKKTSYVEHVNPGAPIDEKLIASMMEHQHRTMIAAIKRGKLDSMSDANIARTKAMPAKTVFQPQPEPVVADEEKTLDQVIIDYLASEAEREHLELTLHNVTDFIAGHPIELRVAAQKSISQQPIAEAVIEVKVISTVEAPRVIFRGRTADDGTCQVRCTVPTFREGTAAVIISAQSPLGNDEVKQLVKRRK